MDLTLDEFVGSLEKLSGEDDDRGGSITDLSVLDLGKFNENFGGWVCYFKLLENCGAIVCNNNITDFVDEHLVETLGSKTCLDNVSECSDGHNYSGLISTSEINLLLALLTSYPCSL